MRIYLSVLVGLLLPLPLSCPKAHEPTFSVRFVMAWTGYTEALDLAALGSLSIRRASHVEPDEQGRWWADLAPAKRATDRPIWPAESRSDGRMPLAREPPAGRPFRPSRNLN